MEFNLKRLLSFVVALVMVLSMVPFDGLQVFAADGDGESQTETTDDTPIPEIVKATLPEAATEAIQHGKDVQLAAKTAVADNYCPACDKPVTWTLLPVGTTVNKPATAEHHYYVTGTMKSTAGNVIQTNDMPDGATLCLLLEEGSVLDMTGRLLFYGYQKSRTVNIMGTGTIKTTNGTATTTSLLSVTASKASTLNLYGGRFYSTAASNKNRAVVRLEGAEHILNIWTDDVKIGPETKGTSVQYNVDVRKGTFNMYAGTIQNGYCETTYQSPNVYLYNYTTFNMYGGTIKDGRAIHGGNVYMCPNSTATIYGTIEGGSAVASASAVGHGGNIGGYGATVSVYGTVKDGTATVSAEKTANGGNIGLGTSGDVKSTLVLGTGADISGGTTGGNGGNIYMSSGTFTMNNGHIYNGTAVNGGNLYTTSAFTMHNGYIYDGAATAKGGNVCNGGTFTMNDGIIKNGINSTETGIAYGGNVYNSVTFTMNNGTITGGQSISGDDIAYGGNVYNSGTFTMNNGTIKEGTVDTNSTTTATYGGNIYSSKAFTINGGVIKDGIAKQTGSESAKNYFGGNIYAESTLTVKNAEIANGDAKRGGNIYSAGKLTMENSTLTKGTTTYLGGSIYLAAGADITNSSISEGKSTVSNGGNIFLMGGTLNLTNCDITGGKAPGYGGNIAVYTGTTLNADADTTISDGTSSLTGGNVHVLGTANIFGSVSGGKAPNGGSIYVDKGTATIKGSVTGGSSGDGGNIKVVNNGNLILDGATVSGGIMTGEAALATNIRVNLGTLTLKGNTQVNELIEGTHPGGILLAYGTQGDPATNAKLVVDPTFEGNVVFYQTGDNYECLSVLHDATCTGAFTGTLKVNSAGQDHANLVVKYVETEIDGETVGQLMIPHVEVALEAKDPTCTETGLGEGTECDVCGEVITAQPVLPANGHSMTFTAAVAPSCTEDGNVAYYTCGVCGKNFSDEAGENELASIIDPKTGHNMSTTLTQGEGEHWYECLNDGCEYIEGKATCEYTIPVAHEDATCTEDGYDTKACVCGAEHTETLVAPGHTLTHFEAVPADHNNTGKIEYWKCDVCGKFFSDADATTEIAEEDTVIEKIPHEHSTDWTQGETQHWNECSCGDKINVADHEYDNACDTACNVCGKTREITHDYQAVVTDPDCENDGYTTYTCSVCGDTYTGDVVKTEGHKYETVVTPPNCVDDGYTTHTCSVCGDTYTDSPVDALGHDYQATVIDPTEDVAGYTLHECTRCGASYTSDTKPALGKGYMISFVVPYGVDAVETQKIHANLGAELPTPVGTPADAADYTFVGWSAEKVSESNPVPTLLNGIYYPTKDAKLYAVYSCTLSGDDFNLVTDASALTAGTEVIIVNGLTDTVESYYAMSTNQKSNNRGAVAVDVNGTTIAVTNDDVQVLVLEEGTVDGTFAFNVDNQYLYAASSSGNQLKTGAKNDNASWLIEIDNNGTASIVAQGTNTRNVMQFNPNNGSPLFACYASASQTPLQLYAKGGAASETVYYTAPEYTVTYSVPEGVAEITNETVVAGNSVTLPTPVGTPDGEHTYTFAGWATEAVGNSAVKPNLMTGEFVPNEAATTLYAVYSYETSGGAGVEVWKLVTDASSLAEGDEIVIANTENKKALSTTQNGNNRGQATIEVNSDGTITLGDGVQIITLTEGTANGSFGFNVGTGYLYAASSSKNYLRTQTNNNANGSWMITIDDEGNATVKAQGTNTRNLLQYNKSSSIFSAYSSAQQIIQLYKKSLESGTATYYTTLTHTCVAGEPEQVDVVPATCTTPGSYVEVIKCAECGEEISRKTVTVPVIPHTEGEVVVENEVAATCTTEGSYDNVIYCTVCDEELDRETVTVPVIPHTEGEVVVENEVAATCTTEGSYDNVIYCTVCDEELDRVTITVPVIPHTEGEVVVENKVDADCDTDGSYDNVVYCTVCNAELKRDTITVDALGHTEVKIPAVDATYNSVGYTEGVKCSVCGEVLTAPVEVPMLPAAANVDGTNYGTFAEAWGTVQNGSVVTLLADVSLTDILVIDKAITLDGNDKTLTSTAGRAINVSGADGVIIKDLTINCSGERAINIIQNATNVNIENVTATANNYTVNVASSAPSAVVSVKDSTLTGLNVINVAAANADVTVDNTTINCNDNNANEGYSAICLNKDAKDGKVIATNVTINVAGDSVKGTNQAEGGVLTINGSTEGIDVDVAYISYGTNWYGFTTIAGAAAKAQAGDTIVLLRDAEFSGVIDNDVTLDLNGHTLTGEVAATLKMNGGTLVTTNTPHTMAAPTGAKYNTTDAIFAIEPNGNITIVEGTVTLGESWWTGEGQTLTIAEDATFKIPAGLNLNVLSTVKVLGNVEIEGTITLYIESATIESATEIANVVTNVADHEVVYENGVYKVVAKHYVAKIGEQKFVSLQAAIDAANAGDTITLIDDVELTTFVTINKSVTLDLGEYDITRADGTALYVNGDVEVTIQGTTGTVTGTQALYVNKGLVKIYSGNFCGAYDECVAVYVINTGKAEIYGGTFSTNGTSNFVLNEYDSTRETSSITVYGGTFVGFNPEENAAEGAGSDFTADGYIGVKDENGNYVVREGKWVAKVGTEKFESLADAIAAADGKTVTVLENIELTNGITIKTGKTITLDLNGKTISGVCNVSQGYLFNVANAAKLTIKDSSDPSTGKITYAGNSSTGWIVAAYGDLVLESGTLELTGTWNIGYAVDVRPNAWGTAYTAPSTFTMNGGKILSSDGAVRVASSSSDIYSNISASFIMNDGFIDAAWDGIFVQQSNAAWDVLSVAINGGTIESDLNPVRFYGPAATSYVNGEDCVDIALNGGTLTYTGTEAREWLVDGILRLGGGVNAEQFMKDSTVTASEAFAAANVAEDYKWVESDGTYVLTAKTYVAQIGSKQFESLADAVDAADNGDTVLVLENIELTDGITIAADKTITLDLNGKTVSLVRDGELSAYDQLIDNYGTLTVTDSSTESNGELKYQYVGPTVSTGFAAVTIVNRDGATLTIAGGTVNNCTTTGHTAYAIDNISYSKVTTLNITGGTVTSIKGDNRGLAVRACVNGTQTGLNVVNISGGTIIGGFAGFQVFNISSNDAPADINITGGTINAGSYAMYTSFMGADTSSVDISISGGTFNAPYALFLYNSKSGSADADKVFNASVSGGTFNGEVWIYAMDAEGDYAYQPVISGGVFQDPVYEVFCAEGFIPTENGDGTYGVKVGKYVAQIGDDKFESLADAIAAADENDTITLIHDVELTTFVTINKSITLDIGEYDITRADGTALYVNGDVEVTIQGTTGTVTGTQALYVNKGLVKIYSGNFCGAYDECVAVYLINTGKAEIYGGTFSTNGTSNFVLNEYDSTRETSSITVYGGTFVGFNPANNAAEGAGTNFCADGYTALPDLSGNFIAGSKPDAEANNLGAITVPAGDYMVYGGGSNTEEMPLNFVMQYLAKQNAADMATSPFADWYGDFVLTFTGIEDGSFVADNCYLAGYYGDFGWVKVPVDGMVIENGAHYPVMLGVGMGQKYEYICSGVQDFRCALYLDPAIFEANPNLKVTLELNVVDNSKGENAAAEALVNGQNVYEVTEHIFGIEHFMEPVAQIGETKYYFLEKALEAYNDGDVIVLLKDVDLGNTPLVVPGVVFDLNGNTLTGDIIATIKMNGGYLVTTMYNMAGPDNSKYITTNAVFALDVQGNLTLVSGEIELSESWRTLPGQQLTIAADATFTVPAGMDMLVLGNVKVEGTVVIDGSVTLGNTNATVEAVSGLNVVSGVDGYKVTYKNGTYSLIKDNIVAWNVNTGVEYETVETAMAEAKAGETVQLLVNANANAFFIWADITLDLNGYELTANGVAAMPTADVIDSSAGNTGLLIVPSAVAFAYQHDNAQLVIKTDAGYRFADVQMKQMLTLNGEKYTFSLGMEDAGSDMFLAELISQYGAENLKLQFRAHITWTTDTGDVSQDFRFLDTTANSFADLCVQRGSYKGRMNMNIVNAVGLQNLTFVGQVVILDAAGNVIQTISGEPIVAATVS